MAGKGFIGQPSLACGDRISAVERPGMSVPAEMSLIAIARWIDHLETKSAICGLFSLCLCDESSQYVAALGFTVVFSRPPTRSQVHGHRVEFRWEC